MRSILVLCLLMMCVGCSSIAYYAQSVQGQLQIIAKSRPITALLKDDHLPANLASKLSQAMEIRDFASRELALPDNNSYRYYADLDREYVVWNVFATPALSLQAKEWCFLFVGCLSYRGYFSNSRADAFASRLEQQGFDTWVGGVTAYSTLGWFTDPVLNTMLSRDNDYLARIIFHELAHQKIYIKNDTAFNEAFAETVALEGIRRWYALRSDTDSYRNFLSRLQHEEQFVSLVLQYRDKLDRVYESTMMPGEKLLQKNRLLQAMVNDYRLMRTGWGNDGRYDSWFATGLNNAKLMAVSTYRLYVPVLRKQLEMLGSNLPAFYTFIERLGQCSFEERKSYFENGGHGTACLN
ncbi:MAG TPA: aminopeptidase [Gammaproteobacteria bacterium]|nr:aminopeptidase [Gammaproteobacteria bacterium]